MTYIEKEYIKEWIYVYVGGFPSGSVLEKLPAMQELQEMWVQSLGQEDPLEEPGGLQSMESQRVGRDWVMSTQHKVCICLSQSFSCLSLPLPLTTISLFSVSVTVSVL